MCVYVYIIYTYIRYIIHKYFVYIDKEIFIYTGIIYSICINVYYICKYTNVYIVI